MNSDQLERPPLGNYLRGGVFFGAALCVIAGLGIGVFFVLRFLGVETEPVSLRELLIGLPVIGTSYFVLSLIGGFALWLMYPLKGTLPGYIIRGAVLAPIVYGVVGFSAVMLYIHTGVRVIDFESHEDAWTFLAFSIPLFSVLGAVLWGPLMYYGFSDDGAITSARWRREREH